jgi:hypothetical protein
MGDRLCPMSDIPMKDLPETVVETVDENEDDHRGEKSMMGLEKPYVQKILQWILSLTQTIWSIGRSSCL